MNKQRRTALARALPLLEQAAALVAEARIKIAEVHGEEEDAYGNLSDGQRDGDLGSDMSQAISDLSDAIDAIDALDIADTAKRIAEIADTAEPEIAPAALSDEQLQERRLARLAPWAKELIARAEARVETADRRLSESFGEPDEKNKRQIVIDDFSSPLRGKVIPGDTIAFPGVGIRISANRDGKSLEIGALGMGVITMRGNAANSIMVRVEQHW